MANQTMRVTFELEGSWVETDYPIHLDDVLAAMRVREHEMQVGEGFNPADVYHDLPLARYQADSGDWVFKASMLIAGDRLERSRWMQTGRLSLEEAAEHRASGFLAYRRNQVITAGGPFKTNLNHLPLTYSTHLYGYAVGNPERVAELLQLCSHVGPRRGVGFGRVMAVRVEPVAQEECVWMHRHLPAQGEVPPGYALAYGSKIPPYWKRTQMGSIYTPLDRDKPNIVCF